MRRAASAALSKFSDSPLVEWIRSRSPGRPSASTCRSKSPTKPAPVTEGGQHGRVCRESQRGKRLSIGAEANDILRGDVLSIGRRAPVAAEEELAPFAQRGEHQLRAGLDSALVISRETRSVTSTCSLRALPHEVLAHAVVLWIMPLSFAQKPRSTGRGGTGSGASSSRTRPGFVRQRYTRVSSAPNSSSAAQASALVELES